MRASKPVTKPTQTKRAANERVAPDDPEQSSRFLEAARKAEADDTAKGADRAFKAVVKPRKIVLVWEVNIAGVILEQRKNPAWRQIRRGFLSKAPP